MSRHSSCFKQSSSNPLTPSLSQIKIPRNSLADFSKVQSRFQQKLKKEHASKAVLKGDSCFIQVVNQAKDISNYYKQYAIELGAKVYTRFSKKCTFVLTNLRTSKEITQARTSSPPPKVVNILWLQLLYKYKFYICPDPYLIKEPQPAQVKCFDGQVEQLAKKISKGHCIRFMQSLI